MLTHIEFENYRIFKKRQVLDIKPITILFGKNNAGKSAVMKLPSLCMNIYKSDDKSSFDSKANDNLRLFRNYRDLIYGRGTQSTYVKISNDLGNYEEITFHVDIEKLIVDNHKMVINDPSISTRIDYIGPYRESPELDLRIDSQMHMTSGYDGLYSYQTLLRDYSTSDRPIFERVSKWYRENFDGWEISIQQNGPTYTIEMTSDGLHIPIQDCGTGITQSLPIVIRACHKADDPTIVVLEEPESHLNPAAHAELCQLIVGSTKEDTNKRYLIETHSHSFVLRLQRMLATGQVSPDDIALYHIVYDETERSSRLVPIGMNVDGSIPDWPKGMFQETMKELIVINQARYKELI